MLSNRAMKSLRVSAYNKKIIEGIYASMEKIKEICTRSQRVIVVCGPTATGKSDYAVALAKKIGGEVISADSRQVYKGLDIGSGKITKREMRGVPHHLIDVAHPSRVFSVARYKKLGTQAIDIIFGKNKTPIICGGTGLYIDALVYDVTFPAVAPNKKLRGTLEKLSTDTLAKKLQIMDRVRYASIDTKNRVRLIRAIEIASALGKVPKQKRTQKYDVEWHYLDFPDDVLKKRIHDRLHKRMKIGMVSEVKKLDENGVPWKRLEALGLEYRFLAHYLQKKISKQEMLDTLEKEIWQYAKRQRTWFKKYGK